MTVVQTRSPRGDRVLEVACNSGFSINQVITINPGGPNEETHVIAGFGSLILANPLQHEHMPGEHVVPVTAPSAFGQTGGLPGFESESPASLALKLGAVVAIAGGALVGATRLRGHRTAAPVATSGRRSQREPVHSSPSPGMVETPGLMLVITAGVTAAIAFLFWTSEKKR